MKTRISLLVLLLGFGSAHAAQIAPHRAIYDLSLLRAGEGASLQSASGRLAFEIDGSSCEGYTVNFRMATKYRPDEGTTMVIDTTTTTYESGDAREFRHHVKEVVNGSVRENTRISFNRPSADAVGQGEIASKPDDGFSVPAGAMLPMQHQLRLLAVGEEGGGRDSSVIFDGSDGAKAFRAISFVGKQRASGTTAGDSSKSAQDLLASIRAWPMMVSYYTLEGDSETPEYQVSFNMYENGVATGLILDYGDFALKGTLMELKMLDASGCP